MENMLCCFGRAKLLACIKQRKQLRRLKLLKLGQELPNALLKLGRIVLKYHPRGRNVAGTKSCMIVIGDDLNAW